MNRTIVAGTLVATDGMVEQGRTWGKLLPWDLEHLPAGSEFVLDMPVGQGSEWRACSVKITGRRIRQDVPGLHGVSAVRVAITFWGEDEEGQEPLIVNGLPLDLDLTRTVRGWAAAGSMGTP